MAVRKAAFILAAALLGGCVTGASPYRCDGSDPETVRQCQQGRREGARENEREQVERERWERAVGRDRAPRPRADLG